MPDKGRTIRESFEAHNIILFVLVFILFLTLVSTVHAHKIYLFAWVEGDTVYTESYFSGKKKVRGGMIKVFDTSGKELLNGKTDEKGEFSFKIPTKKKGLRIVLVDTVGHKAEYMLKDDELQNVAEIETKKTVENKERKISSPSVAHVEVEQIRMVVEETLDSRLKPILRTLAKIQEERGPGLTEIIGGIGYIFGIMGLVLYFKSRKKR